MRLEAQGRNYLKVKAMLLSLLVSYLFDNYSLLLPFLIPDCSLLKAIFSPFQMTNRELLPDRMVQCLFMPFVFSIRRKWLDREEGVEFCSATPQEDGAHTFFSLVPLRTSATSSALSYLFLNLQVLILNCF